MSTHDGGGSRKQVFLFSDFELHRVRWFVGTLTPHHVLETEAQGVADYGRLYASQSVTDKTGTRRLLLGNIGHPHWMAGPNMLGMLEQMVSLPREISLTPNGLLQFDPALELVAARQYPAAVATGVVLSAGGPVVPVGPSQQGSVREIQFTLRTWLEPRSQGGSMCGVRLRPQGRNEHECQLVVAFTRSSIVVQSSCGGKGNTADPRSPLEECPRDTSDARNTSRLAGYCFNITVPPLTEPRRVDRRGGKAAERGGAAVTTTTTGNTSFAAYVDTTVVEVFTGNIGGDPNVPGPVISSGVFAEEGTERAIVELFCEGGNAKALVDARTYLLAPTENSENSENSDR